MKPELKKSILTIVLILGVEILYSPLSSARMVREGLSSPTEAIQYAGKLVERVAEDAIRDAGELLPEEYVRIIRWRFPENERVRLKNVELIDAGGDVYFLIEVKIKEINMVVPFLLSTKNGEIVELPYELVPEFASRTGNLGLKTLLIAVKTKSSSENTEEVFQIVSQAAQFRGWQELFKRYILIYEKIPEVTRMYTTEAKQYGDLALLALSLAMGVDIREVEKRLSQLEEGIRQRSYLENNNRILKVFRLGEENYKDSDKTFTYIALSAQKELLYIVETFLALKDYFRNPMGENLSLLDDRHIMEGMYRRLVFEDINGKNIRLELRAVGKVDASGSSRQAHIRVKILLADTMDIVPLIIDFEKFGLTEPEGELLLSQLDEIFKDFHARTFFPNFSEHVSSLSEQLGIGEEHARKVLKELLYLCSLAANLDRVFSQEVDDFILEYDLKGPALMLVALITERDKLAYHSVLNYTPGLLGLAKEKAFKSLVLMFYGD